MLAIPMQKIRNWIQIIERSVIRLLVCNDVKKGPCTCDKEVQGDRPEPDVFENVSFHSVHNFVLFFFIEARIRPHKF